MSKYELMIIVNANLSQEEREAVFQEAADAVTKNEGKVINGQVWQEKHKITFILKKCTHGTYYLINFESATSAIDKIKKLLRLNEKVLRFLIFRVTK